MTDGLMDIRINCEHEDHAPKVVHVRTLRQGTSGEWGDVPEIAHAMKMASGGSKDRWIPETPFQIMEDADGNRWARWDLRCPLNERHNCQVRQENLFPALDQLAASGLSVVPLSLLAASLEWLARVRPEA